MKLPGLIFSLFVLSTALFAYEDLGEIDAARKKYPEIFDPGSIHKVKINGKMCYVFSGQAEQSFTGKNAEAEGELYEEAALDAKNLFYHSLSKGNKRITVTMKECMPLYQFNDKKKYTVILFVPEENVVVTESKEPEQVVEPAPAKKQPEDTAGDKTEKKETPSAKETQPAAEEKTVSEEKKPSTEDRKAEAKPAEEEKTAEVKPAETQPAEEKKAETKPATEDKKVSEEKKPSAEEKKSETKPAAEDKKAEKKPAEAEASKPEKQPVKEAQSDSTVQAKEAEEIVEEKEEEVGEVEEVEDYSEEEVEDEEEEEVDEEDEEEKATKERLRNMGDYFFGDGK